VGDRSQKDPTVAQLRLGDLQTWTQLFKTSAPAVHAYLARRVGADQADDLVAETWVRAFQSRSRIDATQGSGRTWLFGIARLVMYESFRGEKRAIHARVDTEQDEFDDVDSRLMAQSMTLELREGLRRLTRDEREIILLSTWEQLSPAEIAEVLHIPQGTARSRLHRARTCLRSDLDERGTHELIEEDLG
jgi:RNA polymerase sigma factor (sigma-70 family)